MSWTGSAIDKRPNAYNDVHIKLSGKHLPVFLCWLWDRIHTNYKANPTDPFFIFCMSPHVVTRQKSRILDTDCQVQCQYGWDNNATTAIQIYFGLNRYQLSVSIIVIVVLLYSLSCFYRRNTANRRELRIINCTFKRLKRTSSEKLYCINKLSRNC